jgi:hypothetical protein
MQQQRQNRFIDDLPEEVKLEIVCKLTPQEFSRSILQASTAWRDTCSNACLWKELRLYGSVAHKVGSNARRQDLKIRAYLRQVKHLILVDWGHLDGYDSGWILDSDQLQKLSLLHCEPFKTKNWMLEAVIPVNLTSLTLRWCFRSKPQVQMFMEAIKKKPSSGGLKHLSIDLPNIHDSFFEAVCDGHKETLESLEVRQGGRHLQEIVHTVGSRALSDLSKVDAMIRQALNG